ncbi:hypothetical protein CSA37_03955 [Candidatus Fermentibacteria bacterium]|nr:MAG: hypothetical protein CSA37_10760 [Candidatus Fermentibacteria bacterium]PIE52806.1 MAG: hypothetical protein CSA37_03955 [Candidatus Fermentibacteria bacterium]
MTEALAEHRRETIDKLEKTGISVVSEKELPYGVQLRLKASGRTCAINLYHSKKKGVSVVGSGGDSELLEQVMALTGRPVYEGLKLTGTRIGTDEAGKGDYFGPLVAAGVCCDEALCRSLVKMGVADSKKLTDITIRNLFEEITVMDSLKYAVCSFSPAQYNSMFASFSKLGRNSLDMQARAHGIVISELAEAGCSPDNIVIDKFCDLKRLKPWLPETNASIHLEVRAEDSEPAVAAASVIARGVYLSELENLSARSGIALFPGAGAKVDRAGVELVRKNGEAILFDMAKVHFANTRKITSGT